MLPLLLRRNDASIQKEYLELWDKRCWNHHQLWAQQLEMRKEPLTGMEQRLLTEAKAAAARIARYCWLLAAAIQQTTRRVLHGESVPATEKLVSLFEPHADVIVKDRRETYYGHKIFLTGGTSGLILDCAIAKANPTDSTWAVPMLKRQSSLYGRAPRQATFDGGFASKEDLGRAKQLGVSDVCFAKRRGLAQRIHYLPKKTSQTRVLSQASPRHSTRRSAVSTSLRRRTCLHAQASLLLG